MMSFLEVTTRATLRAVVSSGGTLRFDGKETTASHHLLFIEYARPRDEYEYPTTRRQRELQQNNRFNKQNNNFARAPCFLYISLPVFFHDYDVKMPNFAFYGGRKQATTKFYFSYCTWIWCLGIQLQEGSPTFDNVSGQE